MGISFAIPIDLAMNAVEQIKKTGKVSRGQLGVVVQEIDRGPAKGFGLPRTGGALVSDVTPAVPRPRPAAGGRRDPSVNGRRWAPAPTCRR
jgi:S1-C subfamily serine protease